MGDFTEYEKPTNIEFVDASYEFYSQISMLIIAVPLPFLFITIGLSNCPDVDDHKCGMMFGGYFPGCMSPRPRKFCALMQIASGYSLSYVGFLSSWFFLQLSEHIVCYIKHLHGLIAKIPTIAKGEERRAHVMKVIRYHQHILE